MSRDFWMPDRACRVCYECDAQFTIFNRKHHCRICGRVFCGRCTLNTIPASETDEGERVRVCGFCFRLRQDATLDAHQQAQAQVANSRLQQNRVAAGVKDSARSSAGQRQSLGPAAGIGLARELGDQNVSQGGEPDYDEEDREEAAGDGSGGVGGGSKGPALHHHNAFGKFARSEDEDELDASGRVPLLNGSSRCQASGDEEDDSGLEDTHQRSYRHFDREDVDLDGAAAGLAACGETSSGFPSRAASDQDLPGLATMTVRRENEPAAARAQAGEHVARPLSKPLTDLEDGVEDLPEDETSDAPMYEEALDPAAVAAACDGGAIEDVSQLWIPPPPEDEGENVTLRALADEDSDEDGGWGTGRANGGSPVGGSSSGGGARLSPHDLGDRQASAADEHRQALRAVVDGHFRALVAQLLRSEEVESTSAPCGEMDENGAGGGSRWLGVVSALALQAASLVKPDTSKGGCMDPGGYVKVKCIPSGQPEDSRVVKGVVCRKNLANRRMTALINNPHILLLGGALEYQRVSNQLSSLDTLLQQASSLYLDVGPYGLTLSERDHLNMTVARIEAHQPSVLLVEKTVSRFAQERLLKKEITLVLNVKMSLLQRIARCTGAQVVPSTDHLMNPKVGHCEVFYVEKFEEDCFGGGANDGASTSAALPLSSQRSDEASVLGAPRRAAKTLMFFEGCPRPLGCTVLLFGAPQEELKKVKKVVQFAVFAAYHLALETSFLADEGAAVPRPLQASLLPGAVANGHRLAAHKAADNNANMLAPALENGADQKVLAEGPRKAGDFEAFPPALAPLQIPASEALEQLYLSGPGRGLSWAARTASNFKGEEGKQRNSAAPAAGNVEQEGESGGEQATGREEGEGGATDVEKEGKKNDSSGGTAVVTQAQPSSPPSSDHKAILISASSRCLRKGTVCDKPELRRIKYYGSTDMPLGRFLCEGLLNAVWRCNKCEEPSEAHVRVYTHRAGSLAISVRRLPPEASLNGEREGKLWMWHRCLRCVRVNGVPPATRRVLMSSAAWGLSFGKFLELSFSNHAAASRVAACGHSLHRDCLRFYGCGALMACFRYAPILLHTVHTPPAQLDFQSASQQDWLCRESAEVVDKVELVYLEVLDTLRVIGERIAGLPKAVEARRRLVELEALVCKEKAQFEEEMKQAMPEAGAGADILELNRLRRALAIASFQWDSRLLFLASSLKLRKPLDGSDSPAPPAAFAFDGSSKDAAAPPLPAGGAEDFGIDAATVLAKPLGLELQRSRTIGPGPVIFSQAELLETAADGISELVRHFSESQIPLATKDVALTVQLQQQPPTEPVVLVLNPGDQQSQSAIIGVLQKVTPGSGTEGLSVDGPALELEHTKDSAAAESGGKADGRAQEKDSVCGRADDEQGVRRTLSEGHFPILADLSMVLDAAWTGEARSLSTSSGVGVEAVDIHPSGGHDVVAAKLAGDAWHEASMKPPRPSKLSPVASGDMAAAVRATHTNGVADPAGLAKDSGAAAMEDTAAALAAVELIAAVPEDLQAGAVSGSRSEQPSVGPIVQGLGPEADSHDAAAVATGAGKDSDNESGGEEAAARTNGGSFPFLGWRSPMPRVPSQASLLPASPPPANESTRWPPPTAGSIVSHAAQVAAQGGARLLLPLGSDEHVVAVYDDEPTSIIAYAISSVDYHKAVRGLSVVTPASRDEFVGATDSSGGGPSTSDKEDGKTQACQPTQALSRSHSLTLDEAPVLESEAAEGQGQGNVEGVADPMLSTEALHVKVNFVDDAPQGKMKYQVTCYYAKQFDALRKCCCSGGGTERGGDDLDFVRSLCRCRKWGAYGGRSNVYFAKTVDDRFVVKQVTRTELLSFLEFAPDYFKYLSDALKSGSPTCLAKILGVYQVVVRSAKGGKEARMDVVVMENLLYSRRISRLYDLKGSTRSRYNAHPTGKNKVLLDENLLEAMPTSPIFVGSKAKRLLERAVWNDTAFLAGVHVMDYSLLVGLDEEKQELVIGIIDFVRQYTWDKHLESWVKGSGILGGPKNAVPTVISPNHYKKRFRKAMSTYFVMVPDQWMPAQTLTPPSTFLPMSALPLLHPPLAEDSRTESTKVDKADVL
eukprot:SM000002S05547  [mRNA]  locus=s2:715569:726170:- [translate_table: standard]